MSGHRWTETLDALSEHGADNPELLRDLLDAVLVVGQGVELDEALQRIVEVAADVLDARYAALGVRGRDGGLSEFVNTGIPPAHRSKMGDLPVGHGVLGLLIENPHVLRISELGDHPASVGFPPHHPPMHTFLGAPIIIRGSVFGSIYLTEKRNAPAFTEADETLVAVLAVAAGIAVDNAQLFENARTRHRWMNVVARRGSEPLAGIALDDTLARLCADVSELSQAVGVALVTDEAGERVIRARANGTTAIIDEPVEEPMPCAETLTVVEAGEVPAQLRGKGSRWVTLQPLQRAAGSFGHIVIGHVDHPQWEDAEISGLAGVAEVASLAVAYAEQQQIARDLEVLEDRHRIARDLHDHVIQRLFAVGMSVQTMLTGTADDQGRIPAAVDRLEQVVDDLDRTIAQIRTSIFDLQTIPKHSDTSTLRRRVLDIVSELATHADIAPSVVFDGPVDTMVRDALGPHIDAVLREGLSNALRHAQAERIEVRVSADEDILTVEISDDGVGIASDVAYSGLDNLTTRADECEGNFTVVTAPRRSGRPTSGTTLTWSVPLRLS